MDIGKIRNIRRIFEALDIGKLLELVEDLANENHDGHYTIYSFTTNYRGCFGTVLEIDDTEKLEAFPTLRALLVDMLVEEKSINDTYIDEICREAISHG